MHVCTPLYTFTTIEYIEKLLEETLKVCEKEALWHYQKLQNLCVVNMRGLKKSLQLANTKHASVTNYTHIITNFMLYMYNYLLTIIQHKKDVDNIKIMCLGT